MAAASPLDIETVTLPRRHFSVRELEQIYEAGILRPDERVELIRGEIVEMAVAGMRHINSVLLTTRILRHLDEAELSIQNDILLPDETLVVPDVALIRNRDYSRGVPAAEDVLVMVEISDTTYAYDRSVKLPLYAAAGIPESWIFNLAADRVERYTGPEADGYRQVVVVTRGQSLTSTVLPAVTFVTADVLGPPKPASDRA